MKNRTQKIDWSKPIETLQGHPATLVYTKRRGAYTRVCAVNDPDGSDSVITYTEEGDANSATDSNPFDMVNRQNVGWVNLYSADGLPKSDAVVMCSDVYATREEADKGAGEDRIGCSEVRWP